MTKFTLFAGIAAALFSAQGFSADTAQETVTVWQVDTSGHPPFQRTRVEVPVTDVAEAEVVETERVWTTDFRGRPPFQRGYRDLPVVDAASMEPQFSSGDKAIKPRPFHKKRHH